MMIYISQINDTRGIKKKKKLQRHREYYDFGINAKHVTLPNSNDIGT